MKSTRSNEVRRKRAFDDRQRKNLEVLKTEENKVAPEPKGNSKIIVHNLKLMKFKPVNRFDPKAVNKRGCEYLGLCAEDGIRPTVEGMALALGMVRVSFLDFCQGNIEGETDFLLQVYKQLYAVLNNVMSETMMEAAIHPVVGIFYSKNNFGYDDKAEIVVSERVKAQKSAEEARNKYLSDKGNMAEQIIDISKKEPVEGSSGGSTPL